MILYFFFSFLWFYPFFSFFNLFRAVKLNAVINQNAVLLVNITALSKTNNTKLDGAAIPNDTPVLLYQSAVVTIALCIMT